MNQQIQPEEIDVLQFFTAIGNMFKSFFRGIGNMFKWLFFVFIDATLYVKKHSIILGLGLLLGLLVSFFIDKKSNVYYGQATLRTNFDAQLGLQEKVEAFNDLIKKRDFISLGKLLDISSDEAIHLKYFELKPIINDIYIMDNFEEYLKTKDTVVYKFLNFEDFKRNISKNDNLNHIWSLEITTDSPKVFNNLNDKIKNLFNNDAHIEKRKKNLLTYLDIQKQKYLKSLNDIDSMRAVYNRVWMESGRKPETAANNIVIANQKIEKPEELYNLFIERENALINLRKTIDQINKYDDAIIFLNSFPKNGIQKPSLIKNKYIKFSLLGFLFVLLILLLKDFNAYLNKYQQQKADKS